MHDFLKNMPRRIIKNFFLKTKNDVFPVTLAYGRVYIFPNRYGLFFIVVLLIILAGSVNYHNNLGYMMTFLLGGIFLTSFHLTHNNIKGIRITEILCKPVFAGDEMVFEICVVNNDNARFNVVFELDHFGKCQVPVLDKGYSVINLRVADTARGVKRVSELCVSSDFPLGLTRTWSYVMLNQLEAVVYPALTRSSEKPYVPVALPGFSPASTESGPLSGSDDFSELKNYEPGDPVQRISWKSLSRGVGLMTKHFDGSASNMAYIIDWTHLSDKSVENRLSKLAFMVVDSEKNKLIYGLSLPDKTIQPSTGEKHMNECLYALAGYGIKEGR